MAWVWETGAVLAEPEDWNRDLAQGLRHEVVNRVEGSFKTRCGQWVADPPPHGRLVEMDAPDVAAEGWHCWGGVGQFER